MQLADYVVMEERAVSFSEEQASAFAKGVAGDFNPIHDPGSKRFCVPGDLLFCVLLKHYGTAQTTGVQFSGMLDGKTRMRLPKEITGHTPVSDANGRDLLSLFLQGPRISHAGFIDALCEQYVKFSGQTFPDILVPLMRSANVMINPDRPLVIYKDMSIELNEPAISLFEQKLSRDTHSLAQLKEPLGQLELSISKTDISVNGRKGAVRLQFSISVAGNVIGNGEKNMVLSGLREYDESAMQNIVELYNQWRESYQDNACTV